jgi:hypothetical protein
LDTSIEQWLFINGLSFSILNRFPLNPQISQTDYLIESKLIVSYLAFEFLSDQKTFVNQPVGFSTRVWHDQWIHKNKIITTRILNGLGNSIPIHARKTDVIKLNQPELDSFLAHNHLQGITKANYKYGLVYQTQLVAVAAFVWPRKFYVGDRILMSYSMSRHCNLLGYHVQGGLGKLLKHFIKTHNPDNIMTYTDLDWSEGNTYLKMGFQYIETTEPETFYIDQDTYKRYSAKDMEKLMLEPSKYIAINNRGNNKYKLFINT